MVMLWLQLVFKRKIIEKYNIYTIVNSRNDDWTQTILYNNYNNTMHLHRHLNHYILMLPPTLKFT